MSPLSYWLILGVVVSSSGCGALPALVVLLARIRKLSAGPETVGASGHTDCALGSPHNLVNRIVKSGLQLEPMSSLLNTELSLRCTFVAICSFLGPACLYFFASCPLWGPVAADISARLPTCRQAFFVTKDSPFCFQ